MHEELAATLSRLGLAETDLGPVGATLARRPSTGPTGPLPVVELDVPEADLTLGAELGRGGMGVVRVAAQRSLGREVAVKTVALDDPEVARALLREARVMGGLEHPSIVPVHALGVDGAGAPVLVMKRVDGVSFRELLDDASHPGWARLLAGHGDRLRAAIEVLVQVARALAFAHARGVVHRDVKPENVMLGRFGEVYLLDWGVALCLAERDLEPAGIVGTPGYLAPEMVRGDPLGIDARTDVYLLGATLYEVLSGRIPHAAHTPLGALAKALTGERDPLPEAVPRELGGLVDTAMALEAERRPASAEAMHAALAGFLASREADTLVREARVASERSAAAPSGSPAEARALIEARFALTSALRLRDDPAIRDELDACLLRLVERELVLRSPVGARAHLDELSGAPPPDLTARVEVLERELAAERRAAEASARARRDQDVTRVWGVMALLWVLAVAVFVVRVLLPGAAETSPVSPAEALWLQVPTLTAAVAVLVVARRRILATQGARALAAFLVLWSLNALGIAMVGHLRGDAVYDDQATFVSGGVIVALGCVTVIPELWPTIPVHAAALAALFAWREESRWIHVMFYTLNLPVVVRALWLRARRTNTATAVGPGDG